MPSWWCSVYLAFTRTTRSGPLERAHSMSIGCRIGVNTGEVIAGDPAAGEAFVTGDAVNVAARLEQVAEPRQILVAESTYELVRDAVEAIRLEPLTAKGQSDPLRAYAIVGIREGLAGHERRAVAPLVGRDAELDVLRFALDVAVRERSARMVAVLGSAGVGKTRLLEEFGWSLGHEATLLHCRCVSYGQGITFWPSPKRFAARSHGRAR